MSEIDEKIEEKDAVEEEEVEEVEEEETEEFESRVGLSYTLSQLRRDPTAMVGLGIVTVVTAMATFAFIDANILDYAIAEQFWYNPETDPSATQEALRPPWGMTNGYFPNNPGTLEHPLGTDARGRDIAARLVYGSKIAIQVGVISTLIGLVLGSLVGAVAGYYGGWIDDVLMRTVETMYSIPLLILVVVLTTVLGKNIYFAMLGVGIVSIPTFARLIRSEVLSVREEEYIEAAKAAGVKQRNIILKHIIPNSFAPVIVQATLQVGYAILIVAGLSFLGFGAQPPTPSWGQMLSVSRDYMLLNMWFSFWPGFMILITVVGFNVLGDGLRDALDPKIKN